MVRFNQRGYHGSSKSVRAAQAEANDRYPLTRAAAHVAEEARIRTSSARRLLEAIGPCEWHHVSKFANRVDYYDAAQAAWLVAEATAAEVEDECLGTKAAAVLDEIRASLPAERAAFERNSARAAQARATRQARLAAARAEAERLRQLRAEAARQRYLANVAEAARVRAEQIQILIDRYRAEPTPGRAEALRNYGLVPEEVARGAD